MFRQSVFVKGWALPHTTCMHTCRLSWGFLRDATLRRQGVPRARPAALGAPRRASYPHPHPAVSRQGRSPCQRQCQGCRPAGTRPLPLHARHGHGNARFGPLVPAAHRTCLDELALTYYLPTYCALSAGGA